MNRRCPAAALALLFLSAQPAGAEIYKLSASRKAPNLYSLDSGKAWAVTKACYEHATYDAATVDWNGRGGSVSFARSGAACDLDILLVQAVQKVGLYQIAVAREADNLYRADQGSMYLRTIYCYDYSEGEEAYFNWNGFGGELTFKGSGASCPVESVLAKVP